MHKKPHTEKAKRLISEARKGKKRSKRTIEKVIKARQKSVCQISQSGKVIKVFPSVKDAEIKTGINSSNIVKACKGTLQSAGGFYWKYKPQE